MKTFLRLAMASIAAAGLSACAGTQHRVVSQDGAAQDSMQTQSTSDVQYIAAVENIARKRGVRVHWVNAPIRPVDPSNQ